MVLIFLILIVAIIMLVFTSKIAVTNSASLAANLGISSLIIGITLVSIGTDISEIFNSIISSALGHGDINVGDSVGSNLTQLTLVFGLLPIICGKFYVNRRTFLIIGSCEVLSLILIFTVVEKGYFTRIDALFLMLSLIFYTLVTYNVTKSDMLTRVDLMMDNKSEEEPRKNYQYLLLAVLGFLGVALCSYALIQSIIYISNRFQLNEYLISFFIVSIGTSLPELSVDITALKRKHYNIAIGDIIGSCIVDSTLSIGIGQLLFPQEISANIAIPTILFTIFASLIVVVLVAKREVMDKKMGIFFIALYLSSFPLILLLEYWLFI